MPINSDSRGNACTNSKKCIFGSQNQQLQTELDALRSEMQRLRENHAREVTEAFGQGSAEAEARAAEQPDQHHLTGQTSAAGLSVGSPAECPPPDLATQLEAARREGYAAAVKEMEKNNVDNEKYPAAGGDFDLTQHNAFPSSGVKNGAFPGGSPLKRTRLAGGSELWNSPARTLALATSTPFPVGQRITGLERKTFAMLIQRLTELLEFLEHGLNGSFNASDTTLNMSQSFYNRTSVDISLIGKVSID